MEQNPGVLTGFGGFGIFLGWIFGGFGGSFWEDFGGPSKWFLIQFLRIAGRFFDVYMFTGFFSAGFVFRWFFLGWICFAVPYCI